jgi:hypothetical protein
MVKKRRIYLDEMYFSQLTFQKRDSLEMLIGRPANECPFLGASLAEPYIDKRCKN